MLRELPNTRQIEGEPRRRWFFCHELDLVVWFDDDESPCAFQLAYDKYGDEHSIAWHRERGFRHYAVDDGEPAIGGFQTPLLYADGPFDGGRVLARFVALSAALPPEVVALVTEKLRDYDAR